MNSVLNRSTELMEGLQIFSDLDDTDMAIVKGVLQSTAYGPGEVIFEEGERGGSLNIIEKGKVRIHKMVDGTSRFCIATLREGDVFGFMSFLDGGEHDATIISDQHTEVRVLQRADFDRLAETHPSIAHKIVQKIALHLTSIVRNMNSQYIDVMHLMFRKPAS